MTSVSTIRARRVHFGLEIPELAAYYVLFTFALLSERYNFVKIIATKIFMSAIFVENFMLNIFGNLQFFSKVHISDKTGKKWFWVHVSTPPRTKKYTLKQLIITRRLGFILTMISRPLELDIWPSGCTYRSIERKRQIDKLKTATAPQQLIRQRSKPTFLISLVIRMYFKSAETAKSTPFDIRYKINEIQIEKAQFMVE